jgi:hypothetical protein
MMVVAYLGQYLGGMMGFAMMIILSLTFASRRLSPPIQPISPVRAQQGINLTSLDEFAKCFSELLGQLKKKNLSMAQRQQVIALDVRQSKMEAISKLSGVGELLTITRNWLKRSKLFGLYGHVLSLVESLNVLCKNQVHHAALNKSLTATNWTVEPHTEQVGQKIKSAIELRYELKLSAKEKSDLKSINLFTGKSNLRQLAEELNASELLMLDESLKLSDHRDIIEGSWKKKEWEASPMIQCLMNR